MTRRKAATGMPTGQKVQHADSSASTPDTRLLDASIGILRNTGKAKRAQGTTFSLYITPCDPDHETCTAVLQGPRGKTVANYNGTADECKQKAKAHAEKLGQSLTIYE